MSKVHHVLITSAGTASAVTIIKSLKKQQQIPVKIYATDVDPLAPGLHLVDQHFLSNPISSDNYVSELISAIKKFQISILIPTYSEEIDMVAKNIDLLTEIGVQVLVPPVKSVQICNDKHSFFQFCLANHILTPRCYIDKITELEFPLFAKPVTGSSSTNTFKIENDSEYQYFKKKYQDLIFQEYLSGQEYTVDIFCNRKNEVLVVSPRERIATKSGQMVKGRIVEKGPFFPIVNRLCGLLNLVGACNMQFIVKNDEYFLIEINPRFAAGGLMLTVEAGANIPLLYVKEALGHPISEEECKVKTGLTMTRYWQEIIF